MVEVVFDPAYSAYGFGPEHPFSPTRVEMTLDLLAALGHPVAYHGAPPATREEILTVHDEAYVHAVETLSDDNGAMDGEPWGLGTPDTPIFPGMDSATRSLVGGTLAAARALAEGKASRILQLGGGLHHAHPRWASGFCIYNDLAVALRAMADRGLHVAYLDLDVHHGDGVQDVFYRDDRVLTVSLHESGQFLFPGTGAVWELGEGMGRGLSVNLPLEPFTEGDDYLAAFDRVVPQVLSWFRPDALVVQAGADAHFDDPLADLALSTQTFEALYRRVVELADRTCHGRLLVTLGGGYASQVVCRVWAILYLVLAGLPVPDVLPSEWLGRWPELGRSKPITHLHDPLESLPEIPRRAEIRNRNQEVSVQLMDSLARYWF